MSSSLVKVADQPPEHYLKNQIFTSNEVYQELFKGTTSHHCCVKNFFYFTITPDSRVEGHVLLMNPLQRSLCSLRIGEETSFANYVSPDVLASISLEVRPRDPLGDRVLVMEEAALHKLFHQYYERQLFQRRQQVYLDYQGDMLVLEVKEQQTVSMDEFDPYASTTFLAGAMLSPASDPPCGIMEANTDVTFTLGCHSHLSWVSDPDQDHNILSELSIGGLSQEFFAMLRRAFISRALPQERLQQMGIKHVKGILLHGPPGTGKTLLARQIGKLLNSHEPKVVSGPEILNKYVGESEANIRALFKEAEEEYQAKGDESDLHLIVFDELDAICRTRAAHQVSPSALDCWCCDTPTNLHARRGWTYSGTMVGDCIVNQLLAKMDGPKALNNILLIGMTNRKDLIDDALLRPGRFEVHIEVKLPDQAGRVEILRIHTAKLLQNGFLGQTVDLGAIAALTQNYSGAEIEGVVKSACSYALSRNMDFSDLRTLGTGPRGVTVTQADLEKGVQEQALKSSCLCIHPLFGIDRAELDRCLPCGFHKYSPVVEAITARFGNLLRSIRFVTVFAVACSLCCRCGRPIPVVHRAHCASDSACVRGTPLITPPATLMVMLSQLRPTGDVRSVLFEGPRWVGKTALVAHLAQLAQREAGLSPFVKLVSVEDLNLQGAGTAQRIFTISKIFEDAYKSPFSILIFDDYETLFELCPGPRFEAPVVAHLLRCFNRQPPPGHRLLIMATTSEYPTLCSLHFTHPFMANIITLRPLVAPEEVQAILQAEGGFHIAEGPAPLGELSAKLLRRCGSLPVKLLYAMVAQAKANPALAKLTLDELVADMGEMIAALPPQAPAVAPAS
ncbi:putative Vesicular-fusion protein SEC18 [Paratrimastix pyriformis]|uniref:Vesicle-fusing ATPase n=1 Tax=Paratrimastix pyriformis TaxID=342808 RepID=A0ABQ8UGM4_9EUKA|nr:putative Vesicular-fusion protein SEC18 [Paratrimastix pyriformis]